MNESVKAFLVQMAGIPDGRIGKMAAIVSLSENARVKFIFVQMAESKMADFKMAAIIKLSQNEWVWVILN